MICPYCGSPVPRGWDDEWREYECPECGLSYTLDECELEGSDHA